VDDLTIVGASLIFTIAVFNYFKNFNSNRWWLYCWYL